jgi:hypothetical protein
VGTPKTAITDAHRHIPRRQILEIYNAFLFAEEKGWPLNTFITINFRSSKGWQTGNKSAEQISRVRERFLKVISDWCGAQATPHVLIYCIENPPKGGHGPHMHILQHLDPLRWQALRDALYRYLGTFEAC